jgi:hypothetical protein
MAICPLWSIGSGSTAHRNVIDLENGKLIRNITSEPYSAERVMWYLTHSYYIGGNFDFDSELIYVATDPVTTDVSIEDYKYEANDFSIEYFEKGNKVDAKAVADTYYNDNLVDKLRNLEGLVHLNTLSGATGKTSAIYECDNELFWWDENDGAVAEWNDDFVDNAQRGNGLIFSNIPNGQVILQYRNYSNQIWRSLVMEDGVLKVYEDGSLIDSCTVGSQKQFSVNGSSSRWIKVDYHPHYIGIWQTSMVCFQNVWNGNVEGGHFVIVDKQNAPWLNISTGTDMGIVRFNNKGQIVSKDYNVGQKVIYWNTTSNSNSTGFITNGTNNGPSRIFVPSQSGTEGQVLTSAGNAEPTWATIIKSVQITSADYEALVTKDPNTLYLIVDE